MARRFNLVVLFLLSTLGSLPSRAGSPSYSDLAHSPAWLRLLHYREGVFGGMKSEVDVPEFFLSTEGRTDPEKELKETIRIFSDPVESLRPTGALKHIPACAFPARRAFLEKSLGKKFFTPEDSEGCRDFKEWKAGIKADSVTLIFSSAYPSNPASMFGHTLLRLNQKESRGPSDLLSYGVNFAAQVPPDENPFRYALFGMTGGYFGRYDLAPYYRKVNEYAVAESRDLWEYDLNLNSAQVDTLVNHLWELYVNGAFDYYFLDENCSYQILTLLEAAAPEWNVSRGFPLSVVPAETVKHVVKQTGAVTQIHLRISSKNTMLARLRALPSNEAKEVRPLVLGNREPTPKDSADILDAAIAAMNYEKHRDDFSKEREAVLRSILVARSKKREEPKTIVVNEENSPDRSHETSRLFVFGNSKEELRFGFAGFQHDFLDPSPAYNPFSEFKVLRFEFARGTSAHSKIRLADAEILGISSMADYDRLDPQKSWKLRFGWNDGWTARGGYGFGQSLLSERNLGYLLASGGLIAGVFKTGFELGFLFQPFARRSYFVEVAAEGLYDWRSAATDPFQVQAKISQAYSFDSVWRLRADASFAEREHTLSGGLEWRY